MFEEISEEFPTRLLFSVGIPRQISKGPDEGILERISEKISGRIPEIIRERVSE